MSDSRRPLQLAEYAVAQARAAGAGSCDAVVSRYEESSATVRLGEVEKLLEAGSMTLGLRVINDGRTAVCSTSDLGDAALGRFIADTVALADISAPDEFAGLPDPAELAKPGTNGLALYDERIEALSMEQRIEMAKSVEAVARGFDARITNSDGGTCSTVVGETALANSLGFAASYPSTSVSVAVEVMADDEDGKKRNAYWSSSERLFHRLDDVEAVGRVAAQRAIDQLGSRKVETVQVPVVFEPRMAAVLTRSVAGCASGTALYHGSTFLADRVGGDVASNLVTITDDPTLPGRLGSRPFDAEGVTVGRRALLNAGVFEGFLFDVYTARRSKSVTTGSAHRGTGSAPAPGGSNVVLEPGSEAADSIIGGVSEGLLVTTLMGMGFNPTTGDFSRGSGGFWIKDGAVAFPVSEISISGNMSTMLASVDAVGDDLTWFGSVAAPTIRVAEMTVSGT